MKFTEFDKKYVVSLCFIAAVDLFFLIVNTGLLGELLLAFTIPLFMLVLGYALSMMSIYEVAASARGIPTYAAGAVYVQLMDLRTIILNNKGIYAWGAPHFEKVALAPAVAMKIVLMALSVFLVFGFAGYSLPKRKAANWGEYLCNWIREYRSAADGPGRKRTQKAILSNLIYWGVTGFSSGYAVTRLLILTGAQWFADTRHYAPHGDFSGFELVLTISIGLVVMALGVGSWVNEGCE